MVMGSGWAKKCGNIENLYLLGRERGYQDSSN